MGAWCMGAWVHGCMGWSRLVTMTSPLSCSTSAGHLVDVQPEESVPLLVGIQGTIPSRLLPHHIRLGPPRKCGFANRACSCTVPCLNSASRNRFTLTPVPNLFLFAFHLQRFDAVYLFFTVNKEGRFEVSLRPAVHTRCCYVSHCVLTRARFKPLLWFV